MVDIVVPPLGESVTEATIAKWLVKEGDAVAVDQALCELETDKVTLEVNAPSAGVLKSIAAKAGQNVAVGAVLGAIEAGAKGAAAPAPAKPAETAKATPAPAAPVAAPAPAPQAAPAAAAHSDDLSPAVRKMIADNNLNAASIPASGKDGRLTKEDVQNYLASKPAAAPVAAAAPAAPKAPRVDSPREERVRMTKLRQTIAKRLKEAQNTAAMLTTFNEVDMSAVMALRGSYKDAFEKKHKTKLGFMSFFVKAAVAALKEFPAVNAEIDGEDIVYKNFYDVGVAVSTPNGLVVPVLRDADGKSFAQIEGDIVDFGKRAGEGKLSMAEMQGGTFTITNGGVFGSMMSTPILNAPQSGILGMHSIKERAVVVNGQIVIRPMMYIALSYDHRIVDGREAVSFLYRIKEAIEDPQRLLLDM
ncbi:MAG TPA: 2-oxoglutarate dehydrogenase complex dihydrolipoyllysine-residue succinyltransferase [Alphaproteobacteria bacterium]